MNIEELIFREISLLDNLECDGATRIINFRLKKENIPHTCFVGKVIYNGTIGIPLHFWIKLADERIIDYKAQCYLGSHSPHGIFKIEDYPDFQYIGQEAELNMNEQLYNAMVEIFSIPQSVISELIEQAKLNSKKNF